MCLVGYDCVEGGVCCGGVDWQLQYEGVVYGCWLGCVG